MIAVIDYGVGNLLSVAKALEHIGSQVVVTNHTEDINKADGVIVPGVGAFGDAMSNLRQLELLDPLISVAKAGKPLLGICLGMQLLFSESEEHGVHAGMNLIPGRVVRMQGDYKIPQVGWNQLQLKRTHSLVENVAEGEFAYFVHSYYVVPQESSVIVATTDYHQDVTAIVAKDNIVGMQFHPEKSSATGLKLLSNFVKWAETGGAKPC